MAWLSEWDYRKKHTLNQTVGCGTSYQVMVKVYYGSGTDGTETVYGIYGGKVYLDGKCNTDFSDVRFTSSDGETLLDYWLMEKSDSNYAIFWVEVSGDIGSSDVNIYIYYYNELAESTSNVENTFLFGDDFNSWYPQIMGNGAAPAIVELSDGTLAMIYSAVSGGGGVYFKKSTDKGLTWSSPVTISNNANAGWPEIFLFGSTLYITYSIYDGATDYDVKFRYSTDDGDTWSGETAVVSNRFADTSLLVLASDNILVASINTAKDRIDIYQSTDGGSSFALYSTPLSGASNSQEDVLLQKLSNGNLILEWEEEVSELGKSYIKSKLSTDSGLNWGSAITIWNAADNSYDYEIIGLFYNSDGNLVSLILTNEDEVLASCHYENYKVKYKISTDNGSSWGSTTTLFNGSRGLGVGGRVLKTSDNKVYLTGYEYWLTSATQLLLTMFEYDLTTSEVMLEDSMWTNAYGKAFIDQEGDDRIAKVEGYVTGSTTYRAHLISDYSGSDFGVLAKMKASTKNNRFAFRVTDKDNNYLFNTTSAGSIIYKRVSSSYTVLNSVGWATTTGWHIVNLTAISTAIKVYVDGILRHNITDSTYGSGKVALGSGRILNTDTPGYFDYFVVRKIVSDESGLHGSWGSEESESKGVSTSVIPLMQVVGII